MSFAKFLLLTTTLLSFFNPIQAQGGYAAYASGGIASESGSVNGEGIAGNGDAGSGSEAVVKAPVAPLAPPRVPIQPEGGGEGAVEQAILANAEVPASTSITASGGAPSLGYRPPPPPVRRDAQSVGKCAFDSSKWSVEPQSAISSAIMFDRTTGLSCEECLEKCIKFQDASTPWVCRSLTYDNNWKICDLFAVSGTEYPFFLTEYDGRDYFAYMAALPPTDAQLNALPAVTNSSDSSSAIATGSSSSAGQAASARGSAAALESPSSSDASAATSSQVQPAAPETTAVSPASESQAITAAPTTSGASAPGSEISAAGSESSSAKSGSETPGAGSESPVKSESPAESSAPSSGGVESPGSASSPAAAVVEAKDAKASGVAYGAKTQQLDELDSNSVKTETLEQKKEEISTAGQDSFLPASQVETASVTSSVAAAISSSQPQDQQPLSTTVPPPLLLSALLPSNLL